MTRTVEQLEALKALGRNNFKNISTDEIVDLITKKLPEIAKDLSNMSAQEIKEFNDISIKLFQKLSDSVVNDIKSQDDVAKKAIDGLSKALSAFEEMSKNAKTFEEQKYLAEQIMTLSQKIEKIQEDNRQDHKENRNMLYMIFGLSVALALILYSGKNAYKIGKFIH